MESNYSNYSNADIVAAQNSLIVKVYFWMTFAMVITAVTALFTYSNPFMLNLVFGSKFGFWGLLIAEFGLVFAISGLINKISSGVAALLFVLYSIVNGLTLSVIFLVYTGGSIAYTFFVTAITFALMSIYGYLTKSDLTKFGNLLIMALIGLIVASVINIFAKSDTLYWIISFAGVIIFVGLVAWDTQKIKRMAEAGLEGESLKKYAILGALTLYLDFINLFLYLLRFFGSKKD